MCNMKNIIIVLLVWWNAPIIIAQTEPDSSFCRIYSNRSDYWHIDTVCVGDTVELYWIPDKSFPDDIRFFVRWFPDAVHFPPIFRIVSAPVHLRRVCVM